MTKLEITTVRFAQGTLGLVYCTIMVAAIPESGAIVYNISTIADRSYQALIETLEIFWPNWCDADRELDRTS